MISINQAPAIQYIWPIHAFLMIVGLCTLLPGCMIAHFLKKKDWWLKIHHVLEASGYLLIISALIIGFYMVQISGTLHFKEIHSYLGIITISLYAIAFVTGPGIIKKYEENEKFKSFHRWISRGSTVLMIITIVYGFYAI